LHIANKEMAKARSDFYSSRIAEAAEDPRRRWSAIRDVLHFTSLKLRYIEAQTSGRSSATLSWSRQTSEGQGGRQNTAVISRNSTVAVRYGLHRLAAGRSSTAQPQQTTVCRPTERPSEYRHDNHKTRSHHGVATSGLPIMIV